MVDRSERLLQVSSRLTGFSPFELRCTGMLDEYMGALEDRLSPDLLEDLLAHGDDAAILEDPRMGPVARAVMLLWYCGTWTQLPPEIAGDVRGKTGVVSAEAYRAGMQWVVAGAHPSGARQQGFGAWSLPPGAMSP